MSSSISSPSKYLEYRSDTFTHPTKEMRQAMATCPVGDAVYGEDPSINELEAYTADLLQKEAAIFMPTCTMANLAAVTIHCSSRFSEYIVGEQQHLYRYEAGGASSIAGVHPNVVLNEKTGELDLESVEKAIHPIDVHFAKTELISIENTNNLSGGRVLGLDYMEKLYGIGQRNNVKVHMDGARFFNAVAALGCTPERLAKHLDSVSICLSKGLAGPAGALLVGNKDFIKKANHARKAFGGGMRQVGVIAACGMIGLRSVRHRLIEDHVHCKKLATGLQNHLGEYFQPTNKVESNMFYFDVKDNKATEIAQSLKESGVLVDQYGKGKLRVVTHLDVPIEYADYTLDAFARAAQKVFKLPTNVSVAASAGGQ